MENRKFLNLKNKIFIIFIFLFTCINKSKHLLLKIEFFNIKYFYLFFSKLMVMCTCVGM